MTYVIQTWLDGAVAGTPMSADRLNHMEAGIAAANVPVGAVTSTTVTAIVTLTQTAYNALGTPSTTTLYVITGP